MKEIAIIIGARPNFIKIAPLIRELKKYDRSMKYRLIHTGQHYDANMSDCFFKDLNIPKPDVNLGISSASRKTQITKTVKKLIQLFHNRKPDLILVVGDVNSTAAGALAAKKMGIKLAHIEAGLRSFDMSMPEEKNRIIADRLSDYLFTTCKDAEKNLIREEREKKDIYFVGNIMIDTLLKYRRGAKMPEWLKAKKYAVLTLHRPENVDRKTDLMKIAEILSSVSEKIPVVYPAHPRAIKNIKKFGLEKFFVKINIIKPLGYIDFLGLYKNARFVMTDSGGLQEETTVLGIPCLTLRKNTERPITISEGTNILVGTDKNRILHEARKILAGKTKKFKIPKYWDGKTANRIADILNKKAGAAKT